MQGMEVEDRGKASEDDVETAKRSGNEIYIGFDKGDTVPRKGRKGRLVSDDPKRYPDRDAFSGGWAGGEVGLQEFVKVGFSCLYSPAAAKGVLISLVVAAISLGKSKWHLCNTFIILNCPAREAP